MLKLGKERTLIGAALTACFAVCSTAGATTVLPPTIVSNSTIHVYLRDEAQGPRLAWIEGSKDNYWSNQAADALPASVEVNGTTVPLTWQLKPELGHHDPRKAVFVYESASPHLRLSWIWEARADFGPVEHRIVIENLSGEELWLPMVDSLRLDWRVALPRDLRNLYVEKGADTPSAEGTHLETVAEGYSWTGKSSTYAHPEKGENREIIPAEIVYSPDAVQSGWFAGIEFSGRTRIALERAGGSLKTVLGLNPDPGPFKTRLVPGGSFETPTVLLGAFNGGPDGAGNQLRPWVRAVLGNPLTWKDSHYPFMVNNSWGSGMGVDEALALRMIAESKELGLEMFHIDAGWFRGVGDWYPNPQKFPHGLAVIADEAHRQGLRFGIWTDWTQAALDTEPGSLNVRDPTVRDWMVTDLKPDWKPEEFKGQTIDIGAPAAYDWTAREVKRIVEDYHLDMLEHDGYLVAQGCVRDDHPHAPPDRSTMRITHDWGSDFVEASNSTDVSYHAVRAYYDIYERTRREHPGLLFEVCDDGGRMVDFGSAAHADYFSITDTYDPLSNRRAFYDTSYLLPAAMLESYVEKWPTPRLENFLYMLRSGMMGWTTIMMDTTVWTPEQHEAARQAFALYKSELRPLIRDARLYHVSARPDGVRWDGVEYWDPARGKGVLYAFRGSVADEPDHHFVLAGLDVARRYKLHFQDATAPDREATGRELMESGLTVDLRDPLSSELVFLEDAAGKN
ncbi:MAG TPA: alpha-galactosidase [Terracidiphilus sp.]|nr:alpha-galactosidase [Terracidiphilus sp.]